LLQVSVANLIREEVKLFEAFAKQNGLYIKDNICCNNFIMLSDEKLLKEIIDNLINNAIRFTKEGGVTVSLLKNDKEITIKVSDTGIGIPKDKLQTIFEEFRQVSEGKGRNFEGTGLGLTIVKKYVLALGGSVVVESELNKGSEFIIRLPVGEDIVDIAAAEDEKKIEIAKTENKETNKNKYKILLVEDDTINSLAINRMIYKEYDVVSVFNAEDAINQATANRFDAILMDINLKTGKSGIEAAQEIRKNDFYKETPIVAMTAYAMNEDRIDFLKSGCSHYLSKPFTQDALLKLLKDIFLNDKIEDE
jgi:CheY-like chemotaxis protein/anti-sigma regulatory factor (Ser/Thr protein kinase)